MFYKLSSMFYKRGKGAYILVHTFKKKNIELYSPPPSINLEMYKETRDHALGPQTNGVVAWQYIFLRLDR